MTLPAPHRVINSYGVVSRAPESALADKTGNKSPGLDMVFANGSAAKLADGLRFLFTLDALHN
jgi:hypothetical protein